MHWQLRVIQPELQLPQLHSLEQLAESGSPAIASNQSKANTVIFIIVLPSAFLSIGTELRPER